MEPQVPSLGLKVEETDTADPMSWGPTLTCHGHDCCEGRAGVAGKQPTVPVRRSTGGGGRKRRQQCGNSDNVQGRCLFHGRDQGRSTTHGGEYDGIDTMAFGWMVERAEEPRI